jgi:hypothetical protein
MKDVQWLPPWEGMPGIGHGNHEAELAREVGPSHALYQANVTAVGVRGDNDDVLFEVDGGRGGYAVVHLTWSGREEAPPFPMTEFFQSFEGWLEGGMKRDNADWEDR